MSCNFWDKASSLLMRLSMVLLALGREQEMKSVQADVKLYSFANVTHTKERMEKSGIDQRWQLDGGTSSSAFLRQALASPVSSVFFVSSSLAISNSA